MDHKQQNETINRFHAKFHVWPVNIIYSQYYFVFMNM